MRVNGSLIQKSEMEGEYKYGLMDQDMKDIGKIIKLTVKVD